MNSLKQKQTESGRSETRGSNTSLKLSSNNKDDSSSFRIHISQSKPLDHKPKRSAEQLFMSDTTHKKQKEAARKQKQLESRMAEIKEIEQLQTISEDETDREIAAKTPQFDSAAANGANAAGVKGPTMAATPDLVP